MDKAKRPANGTSKQDDRLFMFEVNIINGPITEKFSKKNKVISRTIQIRGDQTLEDLHYAIFDAFNREDEHMYEFQVGGKKPMDLKAKKYVLPEVMDEPFGAEKPAGTVNAAIGSLRLKRGDVFMYWFDFGDDWWHRINVKEIEDKAKRGKYPKVIERVGESPPQYVDWDEEVEE